MVKITVLKVEIDCLKCKKKLIKAVSSLRGIDEIEADEEKGTLTIIGNADPYDIIVRIRKAGKSAQILSIGPPLDPDPPKKFEEDKKSEEKLEEKPEEIKKSEEKSEEKPEEIKKSEEKSEEKPEEIKKSEEKPEEKPKKTTEETKESEEKPKEKPEKKTEEKIKSEGNNKPEPTNSDPVNPNQISNVPPPYMVMPPQYYYPQYYPVPPHYYYPQCYQTQPQPTPSQYSYPQYQQAQPVAVLHMARWDEPDTSCTIL
ncbi:unnamed protein product [Vicia faba]|uniref:HMA domain-containing protein n=1 Tax=Vicia faba TaxID=3906 RepID=A0AAV0YRB6_VICFA|nr:unnamed protein product [Vicia faba]